MPEIDHSTDDSAKETGGTPAKRSEPAQHTPITEEPMQAIPVGELEEASAGQEPKLPPEIARPGWIGALLYSLAFFAVENGSTLIGLLLSGSMLVALLVGQVVGLVYVFWLLRRVVGAKWERKLALRWPGRWQLIFTAAAIPALIYLGDGIEHLARNVLPNMGEQRGLHKAIAELPWWAGVLLIAVGPALGEELFFRGFLGRGLIGRYGPWVGIPLTASLFALVHLDPPIVVALSVVAVAIHWAYWMTRSLWVSIVWHFANNSIGVVATLLPEWFAGSDEPTPTLVYVSAIALMTAAGYALYQCRSRLVTAGDVLQATWSPPFPTVELPPSNSGIVVERPTPSWFAIGLVATAFCGFAAVVYVT
jgi:membrane protease YdiL (CAAX protease family)